MARMARPMSDVSIDGSSANGATLHASLVSRAGGEVFAGDKRLRLTNGGNYTPPGKAGNAERLG